MKEREGGIVAIAALLDAEGTSDLVRLNALAALVAAKGPESERALAEFRARAGARERGWLRALERGAGR
ncbi:MAG: hypothetical protein HY722_17090 [Planctomycetes bacterium]|nr:hypothetical protein [Planctomycetota bacterium]